MPVHFPALAEINDDRSCIHETLPFFVNDHIRYKGRNILPEDGHDDCDGGTPKNNGAILKKQAVIEGSSWKLGCRIMTSQDFTFNIKTIRFDEDYHPSESTRATTNFANLARGDNRRENLRNALKMIDSRFNSLAHWDNPNADRYSVQLEIISVEMNLGEGDISGAFPLIEILKTSIVDRETNEVTEGIVGNNFSSYVRDYDFSVLLPEHNKNRADFSTPDKFGELHGNLFKLFLC